MNVEAKKKHEFLESISAIMDAHLRYFKLVCWLIIMFTRLQWYFLVVLTKHNQWHYDLGIRVIQ